MYSKTVMENGHPVSVFSDGKEERELVSDLSKEEQEVLLDWIKEGLIRTKNPTDVMSSYGLKHRVEEQTSIPYLHNNQLKDAMLICGFKVKDMTELNWYFNISEKSPVIVRYNNSHNTYKRFDGHVTLNTLKELYGDEKKLEMKLKEKYDEKLLKEVRKWIMNNLAFCASYNNKVNCNDIYECMNKETGIDMDMRDFMCLLRLEDYTVKDIDNPYSKINISNHSPMITLKKIGGV